MRWHENTWTGARAIERGKGARHLSRNHGRAHCEGETCPWRQLALPEGTETEAREDAEDQELHLHGDAVCTIKAEEQWR